MSESQSQKETGKAETTKILSWAMISLWIGIFFGFGASFGLDFYVEFKILTDRLIAMVIGV